MIFPKMPEWDGKHRSFLLPKRDGHRVVVTKSPLGTVKAETRTPCDVTADIKHTLGAVYSRVPPGVVLAGELWCPGRDHTTIKTAINSRDPDLRWECFAILGLDGWSESEIVNMSVTDFTQTMIAWGVPHVSYQRPRSDVDLLTHMERYEARQPDCEGFVLKDTNLGNWCKWKPVHTIDLIVTGYTQGEGKYSGQAGALMLQTSEGYPVCNCSGMADGVRSRIDDSWVGAVVEVKYQSTTSLGRLRHPRFVRVREDKQPAECDVHQSQPLLKYWHARERGGWKRGDL